MKYRFLLYRLSHSTLVFDISSIGLPDEIYPPFGKEQTIPTRRFQSVKDAEAYFTALGATSDAIQEASTQFQSAGFAVVTILA